MEENKTPTNAPETACEVSDAETAEAEARKEAARKWLADYIRRVQASVQTPPAKPE